MIREVMGKTIKPLIQNVRHLQKFTLHCQNDTFEGKRLNLIQNFLLICLRRGLNTDITDKSIETLITCIGKHSSSLQELSLKFQWYTTLLLRSSLIIPFA